MAVDKVMPSTSQVTPEEFKALYGKLIDEGYDILSIHISGKLSGTLDSAIQAKREFPNAKIELVDSNSTSMALGFQVLSAARMAEIGGSLGECKAVAVEAFKTHRCIILLSIPSNFCIAEDASEVHRRSLAQCSISNHCSKYAMDALKQSNGSAPYLKQLKDYWTWWKPG